VHFQTKDKPEVKFLSDLRADTVGEPKNIPQGFHKAIGRMRVATDIKKKKKEQLEHIPIGEGLEKRRNQKVKIPSCATQSKIAAKKKPFMYLDVNIGPGK
jgi:hypothetical protein